MCLGSEVLAVAELAEDLLRPGLVAVLRRVERPLALQAREALLVEDLGGDRLVCCNVFRIPSALLESGILNYSKNS